ncbi:MAG: DUF2156 domain-containing protein [Cyanobacteria bacterium TGS_CYA1]|nr:DUF2156 domain-containing protein [Cyanobacteria bacterium TGS_CYA1]
MEKRIDFKSLEIKLVSLLVFSSGIIGMINPLFARISLHPKLFSILVPYSVYHWSRSITALAGFCLIYLSFNLWKRKRDAWLGSFALVITSLCFILSRFGLERIQLIHDEFSSESVFLLTLIPHFVSLIALISTRGLFTVQSERRKLVVAFKRAFYLILFAFIYGALGFWLLETKDLGMNFSLPDAIIRTYEELTFQSSSQAATPHGKWLLESLDAIGIAAFGLIILNLFKPLEYELSTLPRERAQAKDALEKYGASSLDNFKLWHDKSYFFLDSDSFIAYRTERNVAIALGDPTGPEDKLESLTKAFIKFAHDSGWNVAFMQTCPKYLPIYEKLGLNILKIGEDAVVNLDIFAADTVRKKTFKGPLKKLEKEGYVLEKLSPPHSESVLNEVQEISDQWLSLPGRKERTFTLGTFDKSSLQSENLFVMKNKEGKILAFVNQIRDYTPNEATIDMMRHRTEVPSGSMDFLFGRLLTMLHEEGFKFFSLSLAALSGVGDEPGASLEEKAVHLVYEHLNRFFSYKGLRAYKDKFDPEWQDRFLVHEGGPAGLIKTTLALVAVMEPDLN